MKIKPYQLKLCKQTEKTILYLSYNHKVTRKWFGRFAELIFCKALAKSEEKNQKVIYLTKRQIHCFYTETTCLYQTLSCFYKIESDLNKCHFQEEYYNVAESLLLQVRISDSHLSYHELNTYFLDNFQNYNYEIFENTLELLVTKKLILSITTDDDKQYFDKSPIPHQHIYFRKYNKLVDCTKDISLFLNKILNFKSKSKKQSHIFYVNNSLKTDII